MANQLVADFLKKVELTEIVPIVPPVPDTDLVAYYELIASRFANPEVGDTVARLCLDGSNRQPKFIIPSIADRLAQGLAVDGLALESALWCRYCAGTDDAGKAIPPNDDSAARLKELALAARSEPEVFPRQLVDIYGDVGHSSVFLAHFARHLRALWEKGTVAVLTGYLARP